MTACPVCANVEGNREHQAREMMFGTGEEFRYLECAACGSLHLLEPPADLGPYYPEDYYSLEDDEGAGLKRRLRALMRRLEAREVVGSGDRIGAIVSRFRPDDRLGWFLRAGVGFHAALLDVGCGSGSLLRRLRDVGFTDLTGVDPNVAESLPPEPGLLIRRGEVADIAATGATFDLVMFNHVFEHLADPVGTLRSTLRLLRSEGSVLIRTPNAASRAWRRYGTDWFALDAPRHLHVYTPDSLERVARQVGFGLADVFYDSWAIQFWGSEQYRRGIPLVGDRRSYAVDPGAGTFTREEIDRFAAEAIEANAAGDGDAFGAILRPMRAP